LKSNESFIPISGFTLVEILITVAVFSVLILTLFSSFNLFISSANNIKQEVLQIEKITTTFTQITTDIQMVFLTHPPRYSKPSFDSDLDPYRLEGEESELSFASLHYVKYNNDLTEGVVRIVYYLRPRKNDNSFDLCRKQVLPPYSDMEKSCFDPVIVADISSFELVYIDRNGEECDSWDSESPEYEYMFPSAVNFKIDLNNDNVKRTIESSVSLPVGRIPIK
jgi:general secretion pathway protein J